MIKAITVINHLGESLRLDLEDPYKTGLAVTKIDGLGPVKANLNFTEMATIDGSKDNTSRLDTRNIVLNLLFFEHPSIEATRYLTYKYFPTKHDVTITVETDTRTATARGRVESNEPDIFSDKEGCQISIVCSDPYFYKGDAKHSEETIEFYASDPVFEYPFENDDLYLPKLIMSESRVIVDRNVYYEGNYESGLILKLHAVGTVEGIHLYEVLRSQHMFLDTIMINGDTITVDTRRGKKSITLTRAGVSTNILNVLGEDPDWITLIHGDNQLTFTADDGSQYLQFTVTYPTLYTGV